MQQITLNVSEQEYDFLMELFERMQLDILPKDNKLDPVKDASLISALRASEKESLEHPETCTDWNDILKEWDEEEAAVDNPPL